MTRITKMRASGARAGGERRLDAAARCLVERGGGERWQRNHDEHVKEHASRVNLHRCAHQEPQSCGDGHGRVERRDEQRSQSERHVASVDAYPHGGRHRDGDRVLKNNAGHDVWVREEKPAQHPAHKRHEHLRNRNGNEHGGGPSEGARQVEEVVTQRTLEGHKGKHGRDQGLEDSERVGCADAKHQAERYQKHHVVGDDVAQAPPYCHAAVLLACETRLPSCKNSEQARPCMFPGCVGAVRGGNNAQEQHAYRGVAVCPAVCLTSSTGPRFSAGARVSLGWRPILANYCALFLARRAFSQLSPRMPGKNVQ